jgi:hypothetical protein
MRFAMSKAVLGQLAVGGLVAATLAACSSDGSSDVAGVDTAPSSPASTTTTSTATPEAAPDAVSTFTDSFDDDQHGWALPPSPSGTTTIEGGNFVWESKLPHLRPHILPATLGEAYDQGRLAMTDVVVRASVTPERGAAAMGVFCREVPDTDADFQWYEFVVRDGYAAIRHADLAGNLDVLAETRDVQVALGSAISLEATCVDTPAGTVSLALSLDGSPVLDADADDPLGNGAAGLQAYDATKDESADRFLIAWHDFAVEPADG